MVVMEAALHPQMSLGLVHLAACLHASHPTTLLPTLSIPVVLLLLVVLAAPMRAAFAIEIHPWHVGILQAAFGTCGGGQSEHRASRQPLPVLHHIAILDA